MERTPAGIWGMLQIWLLYLAYCQYRLSIGCSPKYNGQDEKVVLNGIADHSITSKVKTNRVHRLIHYKQR